MHATIHHDDAGIWSAILDDGTEQGTVIRTQSKTLLETLLDHLDERKADVAADVSAVVAAAGRCHLQSVRQACMHLGQGWAAVSTAACWCN
jgi:hypothetical protein